jgi:hypothetical protein
VECRVGEVFGDRVCREGNPAIEIAHKRERGEARKHQIQFSFLSPPPPPYLTTTRERPGHSPIPMILTVTPFEFAAEYDPEGVTDGDSLRTIARDPTATVEGGRRAVVVAVMLSVTLALILRKCWRVWFSDLRMMIVG